MGRKTNPVSVQTAVIRTCNEPGNLKTVQQRVQRVHYLLPVFVRFPRLASPSNPYPHGNEHPQKGEAASHHQVDGDVALCGAVM